MPSNSPLLPLAGCGHTNDRPPVLLLGGRQCEGRPGPRHEGAPGALLPGAGGCCRRRHAAWYALNALVAPEAGGGMCAVLQSGK